MPAGSATSPSRTTRSATCCVAQGNLPAALDAYQASLAIRDRLAKADPGNAGWQRDLSVSHTRSATCWWRRATCRRRWTLPGLASPSETASPRPTPAMPAGSATSPSRTRRSATCWWRRATCRRRSTLPGRARHQRPPRRRPTPAMPAGSATSPSRTTRSATCWWRRATCRRRSTAYQASLAIAEPPRQGRPRQCRLAARPLRLARQDRRRAAWRRATCRRRSTPTKPRLAIADRLAKADPGNAGWQRDLSVSHEKIGDVLRPGQPAGGARRLPKPRSPSTPGQGRPRKCRMAARPLRLAREDRRRACCAGQPAGGADAFQASLAIRGARTDPGNAGWQRDLALSFGRVAEIDAQRGERERALRALESGRAIVVRLRQAAPDNATLPKDLAWLDAQIAGLSATEVPGSPAKSNWLSRLLGR